MSSKARILVIDDEPIALKSCDRILSEEGYDVQTVQAGMEGLQRLMKERFDLVLTDLKMPDISGMEVLKRVIEFYPDTIVIMITGYSTVQTAVEAMKLGAVDYICKPFTPAEVSMAVREALQQKEHKAEEKDAGSSINRETITSVLTRAAEDKEFAARISSSGSDALSEYELSPEERAALVSVIHPSDEEAMLVVSHELKSPLASIANLARAIQEPNVAGDQKERFLNRIVFRAERALDMIQEYLTLSKISTGELEIATKRVKFYNQVIKKVLDDQSEAMAEKGLTAQIDIPEELEVVCDPGYIQIVYNNLISNATKYGTARTEIQLGYSEARGGYHYFNVGNVGEWIKEGDRERIFEKYVTLGKRGTGIGLHATMEIVKKHGGDIWVEPCYFVEGKCVSEKSIIREGDDELLTGNNFIFTIPVEKTAVSGV